MGGTFQYLPDLATADIAFIATGDTLEELFEACAMATFEAMAKVETVTDRESFPVTLAHTDRERLLFDFLSEIIFLKDKEAVVFNHCSLTLTHKEKQYALNASLHGEPINSATQTLGNDVKAVTMHLFKIEEADGVFKATVILDI